MAITTFIPKIWSARLLEHLDKAHVYANLVNRDYEGEISDYGDTVKINQIGDITVKDYTKNADNIDGPEQLETTEVVLVIDKAKYFNFGIDDVDAAQVRTPLMDKAMSRAAYALGDMTDTFLASIMANPVDKNNTGGSKSAGVKITTANAYEELVKLKVKMDQANVPSAGRWIVVPPDFEGLMLLDDRFASAYGTNAEGRLVNGLVARAAGFDIYVSNNCPKNTNTYTMIASNNDSTTFAEQIVKVEAYRPEKSFKDAMKGLNVFGAKVTQPKAVFGIFADFTP
jgi:N4-gp56 family major capsid protein